MQDVEPTRDSRRHSQKRTILNNGRLKVVGIGGTLREGSTAGGDLAGVIAVAAMAHALRGTVAPLTVAIPQVWKRADGDGDVTDEGYGERLDKLGRLVVELAARLQLEAQVLRA